jgi:hypothetical protein
VGPKTGTTFYIWVGERSGLTEAPLQPDLTLAASSQSVLLAWTTPVVTEVMELVEVAGIRKTLTHPVSPHLRQAIVRRGWVT